MTTEALTPPSALPTPEVIAHVLLGGDLSSLTAPQRVSYYRAVCDSLGLNPLTRPFDYLRLSGKEVLYAKKDAAEQLRVKHKVTLALGRAELLDGGLYTVWITASLPDGRSDTDMGAVALGNTVGENRANLLMKCLTKAKRRATLSICGLGLLDESEVATLPGAVPLEVDPQTGEITPAAPVAPKRGRRAERDALPPVPPAPASAPVKPLSTRDDYQPITRAQQRKMFALATEKRWSTDQLRALLIDRFGTEHSGELRRGDFDQVLTLIGRGPTPDNTYPDGPAGKPADDAVPF